MDLTIYPDLVIPSKELKWRFSRSSGPGGQGVNTTDSKVELIFDIKNSSVFAPFLQQRLLKKLENQCKNGCINIFSEKERSQYQNRRVALLQLAGLLKEGLKPPQRKRVKSKPSYASQKRRITLKKRRSALKQKRQRNASEDDSY